MPRSSTSLVQVLADARACRICEDHLPLGPRPVLSAGREAKIMIVGQAPGTRVHESGIPWDDDSGDHLRQWLDVTHDVFYDRQKFAIVPMGFCYPGKKKGGDAPPRPECAPTWHPKLRKALPNLQLTLLCGMYAQRYYLGANASKTLAETVQNYRDYLPEFLPLPHPSWRSKRWIKLNPFFTNELLPELRKTIHKLI